MNPIHRLFTLIGDIFELARASTSEAPDAWERSIRKFEAQDRLDPPPPGAIVFTGSSSITFWKTLEHDMAPLPVLNRGFGGSKTHQVVYNVGRIVLPYQPRAVVLFAGTNDIAEPHPKTARQVYECFLAFVQAVRAALPETPIYFISITPAPSRWKQWPIAVEANALIRDHAALDPYLRYIDITDRFLGPDGLPCRELFRADRLHPNARGYAQWAAVIKPVLLSDFG